MSDFPKTTKRLVRRPVTPGEERLCLSRYETRCEELEAENAALRRRVRMLAAARNDDYFTLRNAEGF